MSPVKRKRKSRSPATRSWRHRLAADALKSRRAKPSHQYPAWTTRDTDLKEAQSLELLKIAVHVTLAFVLFVRELLPEEAFRDRSLSKAKVGHMRTYEDFLSGNQGSFLAGRESASVHAKNLLTVAKTERSDGFKDPWIAWSGSFPTPGLVLADLSLQQEIGVGLARRRLDTLTLYVRAESEPDNGSLTMLETYVMRFVYGGKHGFADELNGIIDTIPESRPPSDIRRYIYRVSRKLAMLKDAPAPLSHRQLRIVMTYKEESAKRAAGLAFSRPPLTMTEMISGLLSLTKTGTS
ncbi:uncharacterized protein N7477_010119 [Penicillium maclennaniae]|uniref:uncharacterized protein n=1 Tax=Penicillium maclennaniae TaxID=1343394 RepID=UPI00253FD5CD|nr:uncharacterized protein N7477_010119 [Penicillium maclennaniae]KAJ5662503.1 hypothetical protein N7477_010119 [Penicillium maclennaniae]